jgi:Mg2+/Co2+ transporter CorB
MQNLKFQWDRVLGSYIVFLATFGVAVFLALTESEQSVVVGVSIASIFAALTVSVFTVLLHQAIRMVRPDRFSLGLTPVIATFLCLSPFEAALVVGGINLIIGHEVLHQWARYETLEMTRMNLPQRNMYRGKERRRKPRHPV